MFGYKAIQVGAVAAMMIICYDARYLLVNIDEGNGGGMQEMNTPGRNVKGNISSNLF